jgi:endonuclease-3
MKTILQPKTEKKYKWMESLQTLFEQYGERRHPLEYKSRYQLVVMVILSAQSTDNLINKIAVDFFIAYPSISDLAKAEPEDLHKYLSKVRNFRNKSKWLVKMAREIGFDDNIPHKLVELIELPGIARKSANVIIRESGDPAEGIIVDLHVVRVTQRIGIATESVPEKIEKQLMAEIPKDRWNEAGMSFSFLGREICRPKNPKHKLCLMSDVCKYYQDLLKKGDG